MKNKVVFVIESLQLGGAEKSLITLLQNLDYSLYDVHLITFHFGGFFIDLLPKEVNHKVVGFPTLSMKDRVLYKLKRLFNKRKYHTAQLFWPIIQKYFNKEKDSYDVAIAYNQGISTYYTALFLTAKAKYAWVNTDYIKAGYQIAFDYPYYQKFNKVITVSSEAEVSFKHALSEFNMGMEVQIVKDITDKKLLKIQAEKPLKKAFDSKKINIVSVGRLAPPKGFYLAIKACAILIKKGYDINWYIIGEGSERQSLEKLILSHKLTNNFFLLGADSNPYPYMKACDIYVQTSLFEGLGLTVIEASYLNKPIVSTSFPTVYGILKDEETGLIAEMNAESIAAKMQRLIEDVKLRRKLTHNLSQQENIDKEETLAKIKSLLAFSS